MAVAELGRSAGCFILGDAPSRDRFIPGGGEQFSCTSEGVWNTCGQDHWELYLPPPQNVDFGLWSEKRIFEYQLSLARYSAAPLALLRIGKLHLEVPVFDGTDDLTLNRGVGRIIGTAKPGERGNIGIAGHRDRFFRGLKDIRSEDEVDLVMPMKKWRYVVDHVQIVSPEDVSVLANRGVPVLTLVTCYPFYFVGDAPQRCIFRCFLKEQVDEAVALQTAR